MRVAGLLLTGGASSRFGVPKATLLRDGEPLVDRGARVLAEVCDVVLEVGPSYGSVDAVPDDEPGAGPLGALVAGATGLRARGHEGPVLVLAVDLPFADPALLAWLAAHPAPASVVPRVEGRAQPLCARYSSDALTLASELVAAGERAVHALLDQLVERSVLTYVDERDWTTVTTAHTFADVDTPADAHRLRVTVPRLRWERDAER